MTTVYADFEYLFDSVDFGIAVRDWRIASGLTQEDVAKALGYTTGGMVSQIERAIYDKYLNVRDLVKLCNMMDETPAKFFTMQAAT